MNLILMRHGEATNNKEKYLSDKEIYFSTLTKKGKKDVKKTVKNLPTNIDEVYISPLPRTIETSYYVYKRFPNIKYTIDNSIREIYYGKYSGRKNNEELDLVRRKQIDGDYFIRFGEYGENKYDIENRLCLFLNDIFKNKYNESTILIITHGSISSYIKRIMNLKSKHLETGKIEIYDDINFRPLMERINLLDELKNNMN